MTVLLSLFIACFLSLECSVFSVTPAKDCLFSLTNGNWEELSSSVSELHSCVEGFENSSLHLELKNYPLPAFPKGTFSNLGHLRFLSIEIDNSKIQLLSPSIPGYFIFENSTFESVIFSVIDSDTLAGWNWRALQNVTVTSSLGFKFYAVRSKLVYLRSDFGTVANSHLTEVRILKCQLKWLGANAFAPLVHLKTLELRDNCIETIHRSHLPRYARELRVLDLGNNRLTYLPENIFDGLNLQRVLLDGNGFKIPEQLTNSIVNRHENLFIYGAQWPCKIYNEKLKETVSNYLKKFKEGFNKTECHESSK